MIIERKFGICIIGNKDTGKSTLISKLSKDPSYIRETIGIDFKSMILQTVDARCYKLHIWELSGNPMYSSLGPAYFLISDIIIILANASDIKSLSISNWLQELKFAKIKKAHVTLVLLNYENINIDEFSEGYDIPFYEIKHDDHIEVIFQQLISDFKLIKKEETALFEDEEIAKKAKCKLCILL